MLHPMYLVYTLQLLSLAEARPSSGLRDRSIDSANPYPLHPVQHLVQISHLSPLLTYHPADAWDFTPLGAFTDVPGAKVSIDYLGSTLTVMGHHTVPVGVDIWPDVPQRYAGASEDNWKLFAPMDPVGVLFHTKSGHSVSYKKRRWSMVLPYLNDDDEVEEWPLAPLGIDGAMMSAVMPSDWERDQQPPTDNLDSQPAIQADNSHNPYFRLSGEWTTHVSTSAYDAHTLVPTAGGPFETSLADSAWPTSAILSTSSRSASLTFDVAQHASILQVYGNVGPKLGRARLIVNADPGSPTPVDFGQDLVGGIEIDTERPISASSQLLALVWLDPRVQYNVVLQYDDDHTGKEVQISGVTTKHYITDIGNVQGDWLEAWNADMPLERAPVPTARVKPIARQAGTKGLSSVQQQKAAGEQADVLMFAGMPPTWCCFIIAVFAFGAITGMLTERHQKQKRKRRNSDPHDGLSDSEEGAPVLAEGKAISEKLRDYASMGQTSPTKPKPKSLAVTFNSHARTSSFESPTEANAPASPLAPTSPTASDRQGRTTSLPSRYSSSITKSTSG